jgi:hypothetical protein
MDSDQLAALELLAGALEFLARAAGVSIKDATQVEFLAPRGCIDNADAGRQLQACWCGLAAGYGALV